MKKTSIFLFEDIISLLKQLNNEEYIQPLSVLNNNSIAQHLRHVLEVFESVFKGISTGVLNYENRKRELQIESSKYVCQERFTDLIHQLGHLPLQTELKLQQHFEGEMIEIETNLKRELLYNIEHCIHHLAIVRIGIEQHFPHIHLSEQFGVAYSTLRYRESIQH